MTAFGEVVIARAHVTVSFPGSLRRKPDGGLREAGASSTLGPLSLLVLSSCNIQCLERDSTRVHLQFLLQQPQPYFPDLNIVRVLV